MTGPTGRYVLVGIVTFLVDFGGLQFGYRLAHLPLLVATTFGYILGFAFNFTASKLFTFKARGKATGQTVRYAALLLFNYVATLAIVSSAEAVGVGYSLGKVTATGILTIFNFVAYKYWVFAPAGNLMAHEGDLERGSNSDEPSGRPS